MLIWMALAAFLIPLIYIITSSREAKRKYERELAEIQRKIAAKEEAQSLREMDED